MRICLIRHASTSWNEAGQIQGQTDIPLSPLGRMQVAAWRLPAEVAAWHCITSPLSRARETADLLGFTEAMVDPRLVEMRWGDFEGHSLSALRDEQGERMRELEALGLDFRPPGGESPREVAARLTACLRDLAVTERDHLIVAHKGILRASLVLACGWDMLGKPPVRYDGERALIFTLSPIGVLHLLRVEPLRPEGT